MNKKVYWSSIEYLYKKEAEEYDKLKGGFVYVFVKASDVKEAMNIIEVSFSKDNLKPIEIEFLEPYDESLEWETSEITKHYLGLFKKAQNTSEIIFDDFHAYEENE